MSVRLGRRVVDINIDIVFVTIIFGVLVATVFVVLLSSSSLLSSDPASLRQPQRRRSSTLGSIVVTFSTIAHFIVARNDCCLCRTDGECVKVKFESWFLLQQNRP